MGLLEVILSLHRNLFILPICKIPKISIFNAEDIKTNLNISSKFKRCSALEIIPSSMRQPLLIYKGGGNDCWPLNQSVSSVTTVHSSSKRNNGSPSCTDLIMESEIMKIFY